MPGLDITEREHQRLVRLLGDLAATSRERTVNRLLYLYIAIWKRYGPKYRWPEAPEWSEIRGWEGEPLDVDAYIEGRLAKLAIPSEHAGLRRLEAFEAQGLARARVGGRAGTRGTRPPEGSKE